MATQREKFTQASFATPAGGDARPIPDFPKLPEFLRERAKTDAEKKQLEKFDSDVQEFFKKQSRGST